MEINGREEKNTRLKKKKPWFEMNNDRKMKQKWKEMEQRRAKINKREKEI